MKVPPHLFWFLWISVLCHGGSALFGSWRIEAADEASSGAFVRIPAGSGLPGEPLQFGFQPLFPTQYEVWVRYHNDAATAGSLRFSWNDDPEEELTLPPATQWTWVKMGSWRFLFGDHVLELREVTEELGLDRLYITPHTGKVPLAEGPRSPGVAPGQSHEGWAQEIAWLDPVRDSLPGADPDGDGVCNALERFFGSQPLITTARRPFEVVQDPQTGELVCRFERSRAASEMEALFHVSTDLVNWFAPATIRGIATARSETMDGIELRVDPGEHSTLYLRLDLSRETP